jgi:membrane protease YdiL (CAAX protease family)
MIRRAWATLTAGPAYPPSPADRRTVSLLGLELPLRATIAVGVVTVAIILDYSRTLVSTDVVALGRTPEAARYVALERFVLSGLVPLAVVTLAFRDRPSAYGLTVGDWRIGAPVMIAGVAAMTPVVLWFATLPDVHAYYAPYAPSAAGPLTVAVTNAIELPAAEFLFRGFLMLTLVRAIGPFGVVAATTPFVFAHLGKPELELLSTVLGGLAYGWLAWRTRSVVWGSIAHVYILSLVTVAAA